jgi:hypothetical protein
VGAIEQSNFSAARTPFYYKPPPCAGCRFFNDCKIFLKACLKFNDYVYDAPSKRANIRVKIIYDVLLGGRRQDVLNNFINAVELAQASRTTAVFFERTANRFRAFKNYEEKYITLAENDDYQFIGFFGPEFSEQEIADFIEGAIAKCRH